MSGSNADSLIDAFMRTRSPEDHIECLRQRVAELEKQLSETLLDLAFMTALAVEHEAHACRNGRIIQ